MPKKKRRNSDPGTSKTGKTDSTAKVRPRSQSTTNTSAPKERKSWLTISKLPSSTASPTDSRARSQSDSRDTSKTRAEKDPRKSWLTISKRPSSTASSTDSPTRSDSQDTLRLSGDRPARFTPPKDRIPRSDDQFTDDVEIGDTSRQYNITSITAALQDLTDQGATRDDLLDYLHDSVEMSREYAETYLTQYWDDEPSGGRSPQKKRPKKSPKPRTNIDGTDSDGTNSDESDSDERDSDESDSDDDAEEDSSSDDPTPVNVEIEPPPKVKIDLNKLTNPTVRKEAAKLAARADKFQIGLTLAQSLGIKVLSGIQIEAELQKIFELADTNNDAQMLKQLTNATSFSGKLSLFQPTTEVGRSQVRLAQLFNAIQGDGTYQTIQNNITNLANDTTTLRQMARDANLLSGLDNTQYVDSTRLLRTVGNVPAQPISETTREWHLEQASLMKAYREAGTNTALQKKLALTMLQSFAKAAPLGEDKATELGAQVSPLLNKPGFYHRSAADNPLITGVTEAYCKDMQVPMGSAHLVDNATFQEVLAREFSMEGVNTKITNLTDYNTALQDLFNQAALGNFPKGKVVFDITDLFQQGNLQPNQITTLTKPLERAFLTQAEQFLNTNPGVDKKKFIELMKEVNLGAMTQHKGADVLLTPPFLFRDAEAGDSDLQKELLKKAQIDRADTEARFYGVVNIHMEFFATIAHSMMHSGYRLDPIQARKAWLEVANPSDILAKQKINVQMTELATSNKPTPTIFASFEDFTHHPSFQKFEALSQDDDAPPYLKTLPQATANLLRGLAEYNPDQGGVDQAMQDEGLDEVLQMSYYRMLNAMATAVQKQDDLIGFMNAVEVIQQQIATLVSLLEPYSNDDFANSIRDKLGPVNKVIPAGLDAPQVHLKPSAMHCLASILSSVEAEKNTNNLNVCVVKDNYYESAGAISTAKTYTVSQLDGDALRKRNGSGVLPLNPDSFQGKTPLDLYVCDFHHNISLDRKHYRIENLQHHVDELYRNDLVADKFTVAIDCTIDFIDSPDVQAFLTHNKDRIESGELNVVLFRSAQKFDMLGMDNYYGGFTVSINDHATFNDFNTRMADPQDQLKGPSLQGLSHITTHAAEDTDAYRQALMANTQRFYNALPKGLIWSKNSTSAMQVAKTEDPNAVFLDIQFPGNPNASEAFMERLKTFATEENLPLTGRASFGFATTNLNLIHGEKTRLTPGLEGPEAQDRYIAFFKAVHKQTNKAVKEATQQGLTGDDLKKFVAEQIRTMPMA